MKVGTTFTVNEILSFIISDRFTVSHFHGQWSKGEKLNFHLLLHLFIFQEPLWDLNPYNMPFKICLIEPARFWPYGLFFWVFTLLKFDAPLCGAELSNNFGEVILELF